MSPTISCNETSCVHLAKHVFTGESVAVKLGSLLQEEKSRLGREAAVYESLTGAVGIPLVRWVGFEGDRKAIVLDELGPSLEDFFEHCDRKFSLKTVLVLADQLIVRLERIHAASFIHGDVRPGNFIMGVGKVGDQVNVIGFDSAILYRDLNTFTHIPFCKNKKFTGSTLFASIHAHLGIGKSLGFLVNNRLLIWI